MKRWSEIQVHEGKDGRWYMRLKARNGRTVTDAEGYASKSGAIRAGRNLVRWAAEANTRPIVVLSRLMKAS